MRHKRILITLYVAAILAVTGIIVRGMEYRPKESSQDTKAGSKSMVSKQDILPVLEAKAEEPATILDENASVRPMQIFIPSIGVYAAIMSMGLTSSGKMDIPDNLVDSGWYAAGVVPGLMGSAVIGAHVDNGAGKDGPFKQISAMNLGDLISITMDDGTERQFAVIGTEIYNYKSVDTNKLYNQNDGRYVKLITCHGRWIRAEKTYDERLIVTAILI